MEPNSMSSRQRSSQGGISRGLFYFLMLPAVLGFSAWQGWAWWSWNTAPLVREEALGDRTVQIQIPPGSSITQIGQDLQAAGLIRSAWAWRLWAFWMQVQPEPGNFQAGTYRLSPQQNLKEIAQTIWTGQVTRTTFTIPEGWSLQQMGRYFESRGFFSREEFLAAVQEIPRSQYQWLPAEITSLEGFLYPDTYQLPSDGITAQAMIQQMLDRFEQVALPAYQKSPNPLKLSLLKWVTLASIVEKESVLPQERRRIAGVFSERLRRGMKLESDPTVEYGLGFRQTPDQPLTIAQVRTPSPYNTYLNPGLPPGPIASPGIESLKATVNPEVTDYLFFVARYDGSHVFSRTLAEHNAAVRAIRSQRQGKR